MRERSIKYKSEEYMTRNPSTCLQLAKNIKKIHERIKAEEKLEISLTRKLEASTRRKEVLERLSYRVSGITETYKGIPLKVSTNKERGGIGSPCLARRFDYYQNANDKKLYGAHVHVPSTTTYGTKEKFLGSNFKSLEALLILGREFVATGRVMDYKEALLILEHPQKKAKLKVLEEAQMEAEVELS